MSQGAFRNVRLTALALITCLSAPVLGICGYVLSTVSVGVFFVFSGLGVATGLLTIIAAVCLMVFQSAAHWVELTVFGILWILWVATAAETGVTNAAIGWSNCSLVRPVAMTVCNEFLAVEGLSIVVCLLITFYLIARTIRGNTQGTQATSYKA